MNDQLPPVRTRIRSQERWAIAITRDGAVWDDYEVSEFGNVRRRTAFRHWPAGRPLKKIKKRDGYLAVNLWKDRSAKLTSIHQIVCSTFRGQPAHSSLIVRHLNGIKSDNRLSNLVWGTHKENSEDAILHGHTPRGARHGRPQAKHSLDDAALIKGLILAGARNVEISGHFGLSQQAVCNIRHDRTGSYVQPAEVEEVRPLLRYVRREHGRRLIRKRWEQP